MIAPPVMEQASLPGMCLLTDALAKLAHDSAHSERGAIFTRREVVDFMLDLAAYTPDRPLQHMRLLEPSCGGGEFLFAAVERLLAAARAAGAPGDLSDCIRAVELHHATYLATRTQLLLRLEQARFAPQEARRLADAWLLSGDFLLCEWAGTFDFIVGNPPYVRQELIPAPLLAEYRRRYASLYDRADLYVPFIERSLQLLSAGGQLVFICANRWTKNKYGGPLRALVARDFHLRAYVDMVDLPAFATDVTAYPAITLIERAPPGPTWAARPAALAPTALAQLAHALRAGRACRTAAIAEIDTVGGGGQPWVLDCAEKRGLLRRLEAQFPTLEEAGCKVGIGVATGADKVFIAPMAELDVEASRKLPLVTTKDIASGEVQWRGLGVINPFEDDGRLVDLDRYPKLRAYLEHHHSAIASRHVARKTPAHWYRTIDRITPALTASTKLLIPDIKGSAHVVYERGRLYPHHNLYFVTAQEWDLRALQAVLLSCVARHFVAAYSTTMRGGFLRFQAQYLRRIRLPAWAAVAPAMRERLVAAATSRNLLECDRAACALYGLTPEEAALLAQDTPKTSSEPTPWH